jgi:hypothetical protein
MSDNGLPGTGVATTPPVDPLVSGEGLWVATQDDIRDRLAADVAPAQIPRFWASSALGPPKESVKAVLRAEMLGKAKLSDSTRRILAKEANRGVSTEKYERRKKREARRAKYLRCQRAGKLRRDLWLRSTAEGMWYHYRYLAKKRGRSWNITRDEWLDLMYSVPSNSTVELYRLLFFVYLKDPSIGYSISNLRIVDRYSKQIYYQ